MTDYDDLPLPIPFDQIRVGDTVERESQTNGITSTIKFTVAMRDEACIYPEVRGAASELGYGMGLDGTTTEWRLLDRRVQADLPSVPTAGVLHYTAGPNTKMPGRLRRVFANWYLAPCSDAAYQNKKTQMVADGLGLMVPVDAVKAFVPATVVSTDLINELHQAHRYPPNSWHAIGAFLLSIDVDSDQS